MRVGDGGGVGNCVNWWGTGAGQLERIEMKIANWKWRTFFAII